MIYKAPLLLLIIFSFPYFAYAQENPLGRNGIGFEVIVNHTQKNNIIRNHSKNSDASVFSKPAGSVELRASYFRLLNDYWGLEGGFLWGNYAIDSRYQISGNFLGIENDFNSSNGFESNLSSYWGMQMGATRYLLTQRPKVVFAASAKLNLAYFESHISGVSSGLPPSTSPIIANPEDWFYSTITQHNSDKKITVAPEISFSYFGKWGRNIWAKITVSGVYSRSQPVKGIYRINGVNETLTGTFKKRFAHISFGFSLFYSPKWLWP